MRAPGLEAKKYKAGEYGRPRNCRRQGISRGDGIQLLRIVLNQILEAIDNGKAFRTGGIAQHMQCKERNHQAADQQADTVDGIGNGNCLQAAENRINRTDNAD